MSRKPEADVAIYSPLAAALYVEGGGHTGGAEIQSFYLARALAADGLRVRHVIEPELGQRLREDESLVEPIVLRPEPTARHFARYRGILSSLRAANARVYIQRSAGYETGVVAAWARLHGRCFVFSSSSEADFAVDRETARMTGAGLHLRRTIIQYRLGLTLANAVVVQSETQRQRGRQRFGFDARVIRSFAEATSGPQEPREAFLWIGGIVDVKDPLAYVDLARCVPEARFWMIATDRDVGRELGAAVRSAAADVPNLELLSPRPRHELPVLYRRAVAVVNTSKMEGFPNTFLEAWSNGTPALSLRVDPDGVIEANDLGAVAGGSIERLADAARERWAGRHEIDPGRVLSYVRREHDPSVVGPRWAALVEELSARSASRHRR
ncbi:MAG TPA: glycosyltransferase family 4 protein [Galbitalea sp.]